MNLLKFKIQPGQEVMKTLEEEFAKKNLKSGALVSIIGAVDSCGISNMANHDAKEDLLQEYQKPMELSGTGEIREGKPHIHCTLSQQNGETFHGHLHYAKVETWYVAVYVLEIKS